MTTYITRSVAKATGLTHYFSGVPCRHGHIATRFVSNGTCFECAKSHALTWRSDENNLEKKRASSRAWGLNNPDRTLDNNRVWRASNREKVRKIKSDWRAANADKIRAQKRVWRTNNLELVKERARAWYIANSGKVSEWGKRYRLENPEKALAFSRNAKSRKKNADGHHIAADIEHIRKYQKDRCACCKANLNRKGHVDHIKALARGGSNWPKNLQLLCAHCNLSKHDRDPIEFMQSKGMLL